MKKLLLSNITLSLLTIFSIGLYAQNGELDQTYGNNGKTSTSIGSNGGQVWSMCTADGWSIVLGGFANNGDSVFALARYKSDGSLDNTFGNNGVVTTPMGGAGVIYSTLIQPDSKIVAGGMSWNGNKFTFAMARYSSSGVLDSTFGTNGKVFTAIGSGNSVGTCMMLQEGWSIVLGGYANNGNDNDFALVRYTPNGTIDSTFGTNGIVMTDMAGGSNDLLTAMAVEADSFLVVAGTSSPNLTVNHFALARYTPNGTLDNSFGTGGKVVPAGTGDDQASALVLQSDGKIVVGGYSTNGYNDDFGLMRFKYDGSIDNSFGTNGQVITAIGDTDESIYALTLQSDGKIVGAGSSINNMLYQNAMARYNSDGSLDNTFGTNGKVAAPMSIGNNEIYAATMEHDGKILTAGYANNGTQDQFLMARYISGLALGVIDFTAANNSMLIYPNPVEPNATLSYTLNSDEKVSIKLVDMNGKTVQSLLDNELQKTGEHKQAISFSDALASGSYLIVISSPNGEMSIKIIK